MSGEIQSLFGKPQEYNREVHDTPRAALIIQAQPVDVRHKSAPGGVRIATVRPAGNRPMDSFWTGGPRAHERALRDQHQKHMSELERQRDISADAAEQAACEEKIEAAESAFRRQLTDSQRSLY